jgi:hypothetical protein
MAVHLAGHLSEGTLKRTQPLQTARVARPVNDISHATPGEPRLRRIRGLRNAPVRDGPGRDAKGSTGSGET